MGGADADPLHCGTDAAPLDCVVVGAGWTGLATAAALRAYGMRRFLLIEAGASVGSFWERCTYDRIKLHTPWHGLPCDGGMSHFDYPMFKPRAAVLRYLRAYHALHGLEPHTRLGERLVSIERVSEGQWLLHVESASHGRRALSCRAVALCTSKLRQPTEPCLPGRDSFHGQVLHSSAYRNGRALAGRRVLVAGSGNSAAEIAVDLAEHGAAEVCLLAAGPRQFVPMGRFAEMCRGAYRSGVAPCFEEVAFRDWKLRHGTEAFAAAAARRSATMASLSAETASLGVDRPLVGFGEAQVESGRIATFDTGLLPLLRSGRVGVRKARLRGFSPTAALLSDGSSVEADAVVLATGFRPDFDQLFAQPELFLARGQPGKGTPPECPTPLTDGADRSTVDPSLFVVGIDHAVNGGMAMGMQGWSCGYRIAQQLGHLPEQAEFSLAALPERQCDVLRRRGRRRRAALGVAAALAAVAVGGAAVLVRARRRR